MKNLKLWPLMLMLILIQVGCTNKASNKIENTKVESASDTETTDRITLFAQNMDGSERDKVYLAKLIQQEAEESEGDAESTPEDSAADEGDL